MLVLTAYNVFLIVILRKYVYRVILLIRFRMKWGIILKKRRFSTTEKVLLSVLIVLMAAVLAVGAFIIVGNVNRANYEAENPTIATVTTDENFSFDTSESTKSEDKPENTKATKKQEPEETATDVTVKSDTKTNKNTTATEPKATQKPTKPNNKPNNTTATTSEAIPVVEPTTNSNHNSTEVCKINGTKCYVGDTITVALNVKTPKVLINFQGYTEYDSSYLKFVSAKANVNGLVNNHESAIYYNGSDISRGFDFTNTGTLYTATFKVQKSGSTTIKNIIQVLTDMNDTPVKESDCTISVKVYG